MGGKIHVAEKINRKAKKMIPELIVSGVHSGYFTMDEESEIVHQINKSGARLLILGMGVPRQELWAARNKGHLPQVDVIVSGGAIMDFITEEIKRAPLWMRRIQMEWVYRLYLEPGRMWKRYLTGNVLFFYHVMKQSLKSS